MFSLKKEAFRWFKINETKIHELNYLFWECTTRCNLNCLHCGSDCAKDSTYQDMPLNDFLHAIDTIDTIPKDFIVVLTGGEPLLRKDLEQCGREIKKRGMNWSMVTNGYLYTEERHRSLINAGMGALTMSLDGLETNHNWLRNNKNSFDRVDKAIKIVTQSKHLNFDIVTCVNQKNIDELEEIKEYLIKKGVKAWRLFTIIPIGRAKDNADLNLSNQQFQYLMKFIEKARTDKRLKTNFSCEGYVGPYEGKVRDNHFFCRAGINIASVLIDGSISACPNIDRSFAQGNIYNENFYEVWKNRFQPFRNRKWNKVGSCANCKEYKYCQGNGFHNWHNDKEEVLVCHFNKLNQTD